MAISEKPGFPNPGFRNPWFQISASKHSGMDIPRGAHDATSACQTSGAAFSFPKQVFGH